MEIQPVVEHEPADKRVEGKSQSADKMGKKNYPLMGFGRWDFPSTRLSTGSCSTMGWISTIWPPTPSSTSRHSLSCVRPSSTSHPLGLWLKIFNVKPKVVGNQHAECGGAMVSKMPNVTWPKGTFVETVKGWQQLWFYITEPRDATWAAAPEF